MSNSYESRSLNNNNNAVLSEHNAAMHPARASQNGYRPTIKFIIVRLRLNIYTHTEAWALEQGEQREQLLPQLLARESRP